MSENEIALDRAADAGPPAADDEPMKLIKRVNSTGRGRITSDEVRVRVLDGDPRTFDVDFDLDGLSGGDAARVVLEAGCAGSNTVLRFECGTKANPVPPTDRSLPGLYGDRVYFNAKLVDVGDRAGRLIARGLRLPPKGAGPDEGNTGGTLLPVQLSDQLGRELWRVEFTPGETVLLVNKDRPTLKEQIKGDPTVAPLVFPAILREILGEAVLDDDASAWSRPWLEFARDKHPSKEKPPAADEDCDARRQWVDDCVAAILEFTGMNPADEFVIDRSD